MVIGVIAGDMAEMGDQVVVDSRGVATVEGDDNGMYTIDIGIITPDMIDNQGRLVVISISMVPSYAIMSNKDDQKSNPVIIKKQNNEITIKKRLDAIR